VSPLSPSALPLLPSSSRSQFWRCVSYGFLGVTDQPSVCRCYRWWKRLPSATPLLGVFRCPPLSLSSTRSSSRDWTPSLSCDCGRFHILTLLGSERRNKGRRESSQVMIPTSASALSILTYIIKFICCSDLV